MESHRKPWNLKTKILRPGKSWKCTAVMESVKSSRVISLFTNKLVGSLMGRFVKDSLMENVTSIVKLLSVDLSKTDNHRSNSGIDIGFATETELERLSSVKMVTDRQMIISARHASCGCKPPLKSSVTRQR